MNKMVFDQKKGSEKADSDSNPNFEFYFRIGVSDDFILLRADFPMQSISPGEFSSLCRKMFKKNEETRRHGR